MKKTNNDSLGTFLLNRLHLPCGRIQNPAVALENDFTIEHAGLPSNEIIHDLVVEYYTKRGFDVDLDVHNLTGSLTKGNELFSVAITNVPRFHRIMCTVQLVP